LRCVSCALVWPRGGRVADARGRSRSAASAARDNQTRHPNGRRPLGKVPDVKGIGWDLLMIGSRSRRFSLSVSLDPAED
jgi:hypothetical protein